jgi:capsid assembly protease
MTKLAMIADRVLNRPLMIMPDKLALIASVLDGRIGIDASDFKDIEAAHLREGGPDASRYVGTFEPIDPENPKAGRKPYRTTDKGVAIIPVIGSLVNRGSWLDAMSGVTSYERLKYTIGAAAADDAVTSIILDMDSPGGEAVGAFEAGDAVAAAARVKEVVAVVNGMAASAAYAIASQATRVVTTSSGISGSIGVVMMHADYSVAIANKGIKPTLIHAGARKVDGNPYQPLTDDVKSELQAEIGTFYDLFVTSVAVGRPGMTEEAIRATEARTYIGADAVAVGLADAVGSFESTLSDLSARTATASSKPRKGFSMSKETEPTFTASQLNEAVAKALADAGIKPAAAAAAPATVSAADAVKADRARFAAITALPEAKGREGLAMNLATSTDMTVDQVKVALAAAPAAVAAARAGDSDIGLTVDHGADASKSGQNASALWDAALTSRGMKIG